MRPCLLKISDCRARRQSRTEGNADLAAGASEFERLPSRLFWHRLLCREDRSWSTLELVPVALILVDIHKVSSPCRIPSFLLAHVVHVGPGIVDRTGHPSLLRSGSTLRHAVRLPSSGRRHGQSVRGGNRRLQLQCRELDNVRDGQRGETSYLLRDGGKCPTSQRTSGPGSSQCHATAGRGSPVTVRGLHPPNLRRNDKARLGLHRVGLHIRQIQVAGGPWWTYKVFSELSTLLHKQLDRLEPQLAHSPFWISQRSRQYRE